jgi:RNA polymerase sigma factor FliA
MAEERNIEFATARSGVDRDQLILDHLPLLHHIVGRMTFDVPGRVDRDDLLGWGMIGLVGAADSWDSQRGLKFSTFAFPRIRGAILDELRRLDFLPRGRREKVRGVDRAVHELVQRNGVPPSPEEIASELGIPLCDVDEILQSAHVASNLSLDDGTATDLASMLVNPRSEDPVGSAEWREMKDLLVEAISGLPEQEKSVITLYYGEEMLLKEIGEILGVTESRISQVHSRALYRLNRELRSAEGED